MWIPESEFNVVKPMEFNDKSTIVNYLVSSMLQRTSSMFEWKNLPSTIQPDIMERFVQMGGKGIFFKRHNKYFVSFGSIGGIRDYNYRPTRAIVSNPYLGSSQQYRVYYGEDNYVNNEIDLSPVDGNCVVILNDNFGLGLLPLCKFYATQLAENIITKKLVTITSRAMYIAVARDQDAYDDFKDFIKNLSDGEVSAVLAEGVFGERLNLETLPFADKGHDTLTDLIEDQQYIKASWYNDLGLQANYNMKRESINSNESQLNKDAVLPFVDTMLTARKLACDRINKLFGLNISVDFHSAWGYTRTTIEQALDAIDPKSELKEGSDEEVEDTTQVADDKVEDATQVVEEAGTDE